MNITIINDCQDDNAVGRQAARASSLIGGNVSYIRVSDDLKGIGTLEASGNLLDVLDAYEDFPGVILVNVAPRSGDAKKWKNGTPFGYFRYKNVLVVASVDGYTLSLVKKFKLIKEVKVLDIPTVISRFVSEGIISRSVGDRIIDSQFRSYDFLPRVAAYLLKNFEIESEKHSIDSFDNVPDSVWWIDNWGNCKTTILEKEISKKDVIETRFGSVRLFDRLKDVPNKELGLIVGSSGFGEDRFLELVIQGENVSKKLNIYSGDLIF